MRVTQLINSNGNPAANQFVISDTPDGNFKDLHTKVLIPHHAGTMFQSYDSNICFVDDSGMVFLDETYWNYSRTTSKHRCIFLNESTKETEAKIQSGKYVFCNLQ